MSYCCTNSIENAKIQYTGQKTVLRNTPIIIINCHQLSSIVINCHHDSLYLILGNDHGQTDVPQGPGAVRGYNELHQEVRHHQDDWGHSLDHPPCSDKCQKNPNSVICPNMGGGQGSRPSHPDGVRPLGVIY